METFKLQIENFNTARKYENNNNEKQDQNQSRQMTNCIAPYLAMESSLFQSTWVVPLLYL